MGNPLSLTLILVAPRMLVDLHPPLCTRTAGGVLCGAPAGTYALWNSTHTARHVSRLPHLRILVLNLLTCAPYFSLMSTDTSVQDGKGLLKREAARAQVERERRAMVREASYTHYLGKKDRKDLSLPCPPYAEPEARFFDIYGFNSPIQYATALPPSLFAPRSTSIRFGHSSTKFTLPSATG